MITAGWSACACSSQNPRTQPLAPAGAGRTDSRPQYISRSPRKTAPVKSGACSGRSTRRRRTGSPSSFAPCSQAATVAPAAPRPWTGSPRPHTERTICAKLACSSHGRGPCRSQRKQYAHGPNGKVPASRQATARLRPAVPAPLPKSASDWMHAHGRLPQRSRTNAATPPHDRVAAFRQIRPRRTVAQNLLVVRLLTYAWRGSLRPCSSASVRVRSARRDVQPSSGIDCRRKASAVSRRPG